MSKRIVVSLAATALVLSACGGGDDDTGGGDDEATQESNATDATDAPEATEAPDTSDASEATSDGGGQGDDETTGEAGDTASSSGTYDPGDVQFRTINLSAEPVDIYVRTTGLVEAFDIEAGLAPGDVSDFTAPPADGAYLVTTAGAGDPTCVTTCEHFITNSGVGFGDGPYRTIVIYDDEFDGPSPFELWEQADDPASTSNAVAAVVPDTSLALFTAIALEDADFGVHISAGDGCLDNIDASDLRVGGNQVIPFDFSNVNSFTVHESQDTECAETPVGGPFGFDPLLADRSHVFLYGAPNDMSVLVLPLAEAGPGVLVVDTDTDTASSRERDLAIEQMTDEVAFGIGIDDPDVAACTAELLVDEIGVDVLIVADTLVDLDTLGTDAEAAAETALIAAVDECGLDPAIFG